jgi:hypothetical protein
MAGTIVTVASTAMASTALLILRDITAPSISATAGADSAGGTATATTLAWLRRAVAGKRPCAAQCAVLEHGQPDLIAAAAACGVSAHLLLMWIGTSCYRPAGRPSSSKASGSNKSFFGCPARAGRSQFASWKFGLSYPGAPLFGVLTRGSSPGRSEPVTV